MKKAKNSENETEISSFLKNLINENEHISEYTIDSIQVLSPLQATAQDRYEGMLSFVDNLAATPGSTIKNTKEIGIVLKKTRKSFGTEHKWIWEIFLSQMQ